MPTVHLSIPDKTYRELKYYAEKFGVQITDIIKFFIKQGLEDLYEKHGRPAGRDIEEKLDMLIKNVEELRREFALMKLSIKEQENRSREIYRELSSRIEELELTLQEIREPVAEPELVDVKRKRRVY